MWIRLVNLSIGLWLMAAPAVLSYGPPAADFHRIVGPTAAAVAAVAMAQATRSVRWINLLLGAVLVVGAWILDVEITAQVNGVISGLLMAVFTIPPGKFKHRLGGGWKALTRSKPD